MLQYRVVPQGEVRDADEGRRQVQVVFPHEVLDSYRTSFARDCFAESFDRKLPKMAWMHKRDEPIGRVISAQITDAGNEMVAQFSDFSDVPRSRQAFVQIRDGDVTDFSFGFDQAEAEPHPDVKGAMRFRKANMYEISPVLAGSIPGAQVVGVRAAADASGVAELVRAGVVSPEEARAMLELAGAPPEPAVRETVTISPGPVLNGSSTPTTTDIRWIVPGALPTAAADPAVAPPSTDLPTTATEGAATLAQAAHAHYRAALENFHDDPEQTRTLLYGMSDAFDELLDALGVPDEAERAAAKPYGDVPYADPGYQADGKARYPIDTADHVRAAWAFLNQADNAKLYTAEQLAKITERIKAAAAKLGVTISDPHRSIDDDEADFEAALALATIDRRLAG